MNYSSLIDFYSKGLYTDCLEEIGRCLYTLSKEKNTLSQVQVYPSMQLFKIGSTTGQMHQNGAIHGTLLLENFTSSGLVKNFGRTYFLGQPRPVFADDLATYAEAAGKIKDFIEKEVQKNSQKEKVKPDEQHVSLLAEDLLPMRFQLNDEEWAEFSLGYAMKMDAPLCYVILSNVEVRFRYSPNFALISNGPAPLPFTLAYLIKMVRSREGQLIAGLEKDLDELTAEKYSLGDNSQLLRFIFKTQHTFGSYHSHILEFVLQELKRFNDEKDFAATIQLFLQVVEPAGPAANETWLKQCKYHYLLAMAETTEYEQEKAELLLLAGKCTIDLSGPELVDQAFQALLRASLTPAEPFVAAENLYLLLKAAFRLLGHTGDSRYLQVGRYFTISPEMPQPYFDMVSAYQSFFEAIIETEPSVKQELLEKTLVLIKANHELSVLYEFVIRDLHELKEPVLSNEESPINELTTRPMAYLKAGRHLEAIQLLLDMLANLPQYPAEKDYVGFLHTLSILSVSVSNAMDYNLNEREQLVELLIYLENRYCSEVMKAPMSATSARYQANVAANLGWAVARFTPKIAKGVVLIKFSIENTNKALQASEYSVRVNNLAMSYQSLALQEPDPENAKNLMLKAAMYMEEVIELDEDLAVSTDPALYAISRTTYLDYYNLSLVYYGLAARTYDATWISNKSTESAGYYKKTLIYAKKAGVLSEEGHHFEMSGTVNDLISRVHLDLVETLFYEKNWAGGDLQWAVYDWYRQVLGGDFSTRSLVTQGTLIALEFIADALCKSLDYNNPKLCAEIFTTYTRIWSILKHHRQEYTPEVFLNTLLNITTALEKIRAKGWVEQYPNEFAQVTGLIDLWNAMLALETLESVFPVDQNRLVEIRQALAATTEADIGVSSRLAANQLEWLSLESDAHGLLANGIQLKKNSNMLTFRIPAQNQVVHLTGLDVDHLEFDIKSREWAVNRSLETFARMEAHMDLESLPDKILTLRGSGHHHGIGFSFECFRLPSKIWDSWTSFINIEQALKLQVSLNYVGKYNLVNKQLVTSLPESLHSQDDLLIFGTAGITMEVYLPYFAEAGDYINITVEKEGITLIANCRALVITLKTTPRISFGDVLLLAQKDMSFAPMACAASLELLSSESSFPKPTFHSFYPLYFFDDAISKDLIAQVRSRRSLVKIITGMPRNRNSLVALLQECFDPRGELYLFVEEHDKAQAIWVIEEVKRLLSAGRKNYYLLKSAASRDVVMSALDFRPYKDIHIVICTEPQMCTCIQMVLDLASLRYHRPETLPQYGDGGIHFSNIKGNPIGNQEGMTFLDSVISAQELTMQYARLLSAGTGDFVFVDDKLSASARANNRPSIPRRPVVILSTDVNENMTLISLIRQQEAIAIIYTDDIVLDWVKQIGAETMYASSKLKGKLHDLESIHPINYLPENAEQMALSFSNSTKLEYQHFLATVKDTHPHLLPSLRIFESMQPEDYLVLSVKDQAEQAWNYLAANYAGALRVPFYLMDLSDAFRAVREDVARLSSNGAEGTQLFIAQDCISYRDKPSSYLESFTQEFYQLLSNLKPRYLGLITAKVDIPIEIDYKPALSLQYGIGRLGGPDLFSTSLLIEKAALNEDRVHPMTIHSLLIDASGADRGKTLPAAKMEIVALRTFLADKEELPVEYICSTDSTDDKAAFLNAIGNSQLIHFAGHGIYDQKNPAGAGLYFGSGQLFMDEMKVKLAQHPLVFINACNSGTINSNLEGFQGLSAKFITNGAMNYLGSMWPILDDASYILAIAFYQDILGGASVGEALRKARLAVIDGNEDTWAAYILFGCPRNGFFSKEISQTSIYK